MILKPGRPQMEDPKSLRKNICMTHKEFDERAQEAYDHGVSFSSYLASHPMALYKLKDIFDISMPFAIEHDGFTSFFESTEDIPHYMLTRRVVLLTTNTNPNEDWPINTLSIHLEDY